MATPVKFASWTLIFTAWLALAELGLGLLPQVAGARLFQGILYFPPVVTREQYDRYLAIRDPRLGWPSPMPSVHLHLDSSGARRSPAFPEPGHECVSLYGDSFTYADEVQDEEAWGNILARRLGCRVGNFGVGGYGTDQALLRFMGNIEDHATVEVLGIFADNVLRNVNQYRYFLTGGEALALKPRFVVENGVLNLVPIPTFSFEEFQSALSRPESFWRYEAFLPGSSEGPIVWRFPYTLSFLRLAVSRHVINFIRGRPSWIDLYRMDHDSRALPTTVAIVDAFRRVAAERGKAVLVIIFPTPAAYELFRRTGASVFEPLLLALNATGIPARDLTRDFAEYLGNRSFCEIVTDQRACLGHYNAEGNQLIARVVYNYFIANGLPGIER
jgi:hypothetical protein